MATTTIKSMYFIDNHSLQYTKNNLLRFGNPVIVVGELEDGIIENAVQNGKYLHQPITPLANLFIGSDQVSSPSPFSLQISKNVKNGNSSSSSQAEMRDEYSCIFTSPYEIEDAQAISRAITGYATLVDRYLL